MILRLTTVHENGSLEVTPVFSTKASAIFIAAKDLCSCSRLVEALEAVGILRFAQDDSRWVLSNVVSRGESVCPWRGRSTLEHELP